MNYYIDRLNDFNRWLESNSLESVSQLMYFKLLHVFNRAGWPESVQVDNPRLMSMAGCTSEKSARTARDRLISAGLIAYQRGKKGVPGRYVLIPIPRPKYGAESGSDSLPNEGQNLPGKKYRVNFTGNLGSNRDVITPGITPPYKEKEEEKEERESPPYPPEGGREKRSRFVPPSVEEVRAYCVERRNGIDPEAFVDFYASKGWKVGKNPMADWKACVRTWERKRKAEAQNTEPGRETWGNSPGWM